MFFARQPMRADLLAALLFHLTAIVIRIPAMQTKITSRFVELLKRPELLVMSGGFSPLHARMSEVLGYEAFFMSGSQVAAYVFGYPDVGLLGLSEMADAVRRLTAACN